MHNKLNILYVGKFFPHGVLQTVSEDTRGKVEFSNHNFEESLIAGFAELPNVNLRVLTVPNVYSFPHNNRKAFIHKECYSIGNRTKVRSVGFCNIAIINQWAKRYGLQRAICQEINNFDSEDVYIIVNTPVLELTAAVMSAVKKTHKNVVTTVIVPDVRECLLDMESKPKSLKNKIVAHMNKKNAALTQQYNKFVFLTAAMNDYYKVSSDRFMVMEGLLDRRRVDNAMAQNGKIESPSSKEIILYTGTLKKIFGVINLVDIFEQGNFDNTELWICGMGDGAAEISERAKSNPAIKFFGAVTPKKALELQQQATILANPRSANGEYTKYSFPSKTIEYLLAGKTVIMNRLPGIPVDYDSHLIYPDNESAQAWIVALKKIMTMDSAARATHNIHAQQFILENKTADAQCKRICNFIK